MKRLRHLLWVLLGVAASITLWSCGEEDYILNSHPHAIYFCIEDEDGNNILQGQINDDPQTFEVKDVKDRCRILSEDGKIYDVPVYLCYDKNHQTVVHVDDMSPYYQVWLTITDDDTEDIVFEAKKKDVDWYDIVWIYKDTEIAQSRPTTSVTLVRHDDGTYTLKE